MTSVARLKLIVKTHATKDAIVIMAKLVPGLWPFACTINLPLGILTGILVSKFTDEESENAIKLHPSRSEIAIVAIVASLAISAIPSVVRG